MRQDWLLVIWLQAGVLCGARQPQPLAQRTAAHVEVFQSWCHEEVVCSRPAEVIDPPRHTCTRRLPTTTVNLPGLQTGTPPWSAGMTIL